MSYVVLDLETENIEHLGHKSSPFNPDNYIVAAGWAQNTGPVQSEYWLAPGPADSSWLESALAGQTMLVAHNATFELHWLMHRHPDVLHAWLKAGGRVWCTQLAEYLLSNQTELYPSLEDTSMKHGGTKKIDEVKLLWESGLKTSEIDKDLLMEYLAGPKGDIENTRKVFLSQYSQFATRGCLDMVWERMEALLFNATCTFNGLYVDKDIAAKNLKLQEEAAHELAAQVCQHLPPDLPFEFSLTSDYHLSAYLFGGPIPYKVKVPYDPPKYVKVEVQDGLYKAGKNKGLPKFIKVDSDVEKLKWGEAVYTFPALIRLDELPSHVAEQFLSDKGDFQGKRFLCDGDTPVYSTSKEALDILAIFSDIAKPLKELAAVQKDIGSFYIKHEYTEAGELRKTTGMLQYVGDDSIVHHQINGTSTVTTRLSSSKPNMQQLPREGTSRVKEMFVSRFGPNGRIVEVDYTALEVVTLAAASGDFNLLDKILNNTDMHLYRLAGADNNYLGKTYDDLVDIHNNKQNALYHAIHEARTNIKPKAFAAQYGASATGISFATGCTVEDAQAFLDNEAKLFPAATAFKFIMKEEVERTGAAQSSVHREQTAEGQWSLYRRGYYTAPGGTRYSFRQFPKWSGGKQIMDYKETQIANYAIQGESSLIVQIATGRVLRWLIAEDFFDGQVLPISTTHDSVYLDCANSDLAVIAGIKTKEIMESTPAYMCTFMPAYKEWNYHTTPFKAVAEMGPSMASKEVIK